MPESLMVIRSFSTLRKHWEWMTFSADSVSSYIRSQTIFRWSRWPISPVLEMFTF